MFQNVQTGTGWSVPREPTELERLLGFRIVNPQGLERWKRAFSDAYASAACIYAVGDSTVFGVGADNTGSTLDSVAHDYSAAGVLRKLFASEFGDAEGGFINPTQDSFISGAANLGAQQYTVGLAGLARYGTNSPAATLTFNLPVCTAFSIVYYENNAADGGSTTGGFSYSVDGGAAVNVNYAGAAQTYKAVGVSGLTKATHTVTITGISSNAFQICGIRYRGDGGVIVGRFGRPGYTTSDMLGIGTSNSGGIASPYIKQRLIKAYSMLSPHLAWVRLGINDWAQQISAGTMPRVYADNLQLMIDQVSANGGCVLLESPNYSNAAQPAGGVTQDAYAAMCDELASSNAHVTHVRATDWFGTYAEALAANIMVDNSHPNRIGYGMEANRIYRLLTSELIGEVDTPILLR